LEESIVDLMARKWELTLKGREDVSLAELADIEERYLLRYTTDDKKKVDVYLKTIREKAHLK